jgi:uncharacterized protein (DUF1501 family)
VALKEVDMPILSRRDLFSKLIGRSRENVPVWMPQLAFSRAGFTPTGDVLLCVFQRGGMDGLSAVAPYGEGANYYDIRKTIALPEPGKGANSVLDLDGRFGLHPRLKGFKELYDAGKLAVVHATGSVDPTRSHFDAMRYMEQATPGNKTIGTGWIGRHLESLVSTNTSPFRAIGVGSLLQASLRGSGLISPLALESIEDFRLRGRGGQREDIQRLLEGMYNTAAPTDLLGNQAKLVFETIELLESLEAEDYQPAAGVAYPDGGFGMALKQVAQLIKAEVGLEVACVDIGGWDTHETQGTQDGHFSELIGEFGDGITALYKDLGDKTQNLTVVTMSEFGRRAEENGSRGTDHGHGNAMFVLGGGVTGGKVYGNWPTLAPDALDDGDLAITTDQRDVLAEIVTKRLKNPALDKVFPGHIHTPLNILQDRL